jgi:hypothetical protein
LNICVAYSNIYGVYSNICAIYLNASGVRSNVRRTVERGYKAAAAVKTRYAAGYGNF